MFDYYGQYPWNIKDWDEMRDEQRIEWLRNHQMTEEEYEHGKLVEKSYVTALAVLPGIFTIYFGDEVGMLGIGNLLNRGTYPWGREDKDMLNFYKKLIQSRKGEEFLRKADIKIKKINHEQFLFERYTESEKLLVIVSRANVQTYIDMPEEYENAKIVFSTEGNGYATLAPYGAIVLKK